MEVTIARNATLADIAAVLKDQHSRKLDVVVPATAIRSVKGAWSIEGTDAEFDEEAMEVRPKAAAFVPTAIADEHVADKLGIPLAYVRRTRADAPDLYDANVNGWLHGRRKKAADGTVTVVREADPRRFLVRTFASGDGSPGVARALLSDSFRLGMDHLDCITAALEGIREAGLNADDIVIPGCDLSERRMRIRLFHPGVAAIAPVLLGGYRSPFDGAGPRRAGGEGGWDLDRIRDVARREGMGFETGREPILFAGLEIGNSETGGGAYTIVPRITVLACRNGATRTIDAMRAVHLGSKLDDGVIRWTNDTVQKQLAVITAKTRDAVAAFLSQDYLDKVVAEVEAKAGKALARPSEDVEVVTKRLAYGEERSKAVLDHFILSGNATAGGLMQAVTSVAQTVEDPDEAADMEADAFRALDLAAAL